jgi:hypothetical protein
MSARNDGPIGPGVTPVAVALDGVSGAIRTKEDNPIDTRGIPDGKIIEVENLADSSVHPEYFELQHKQHWSIQLVMSDGVTTDDIQFWLDGTDENVTDPTTVTEWSNILNDIFGVTTLTNATGAISDMEFVDTNISCTWVRVRYQRIAGTADDGDITVILKRWY